MKKQAIVIASVLKPVNDTRMFEKMGRSLAKTNQWQVYIIGFGETTSSGEPNITFQPLGSFSRISFRRIFAAIKVLSGLVRLKPDSIIVTTHELLLAALLYKLFTGAQVYYDIQENYFLNIRHTNAFPPWIRSPLAGGVRLLERVCAPFIKRFILAEKCYATELPFIDDRYTIVENKCQLPEWFKRKPDPDNIKLIFSGTIDVSTGVFEAIEVAKQLNAIDPSVHLHIIGYCARAEIRQQVLNAIVGLPFISTEGLDRLVDHKKILEELSQAHAGLINYPDQPHTQNRIPTKYYEYSACQLPIIYGHQARWGGLAMNVEAGLAIDFRNPNAKAILKDLKEKSFYSRPSTSSLWEIEENAFLTVFS